MAAAFSPEGAEAPNPEAMNFVSPVSVWPWRIWRTIWLAAVSYLVIEGIFRRFTLPQWPLLAPDSAAYLLPAVNGGEYNIGPRMFVYPMFCRIVLAVSGDWRSISIVQHVLGLAGPVLLLGAWCLLGAQIWVSRVARAAHETLGLALPLLLLPSATYVLYEQQVLLESFNAFLQCCLGGLLCVLWLPATPRRGLLLASATAALGIFMYFANPRWGGAMPTVVAFALLAAVLGRDHVRGWWRALWPVLACSVAVYFGLGRIQSSLVPPDPWLNTFTPKHLLWMHADLALNEFRQDLAAPQPPPYADLLRKMIPKVEKEIVGVGTSHWMTITFNAAALLYVADCPDADLNAYFKGDPEGYRQFCLNYYLRIVRHQPRAYFGEVGRMLAYYYAGPQNDGAFREFSVAITDAFPGCASLARYLAGAGALPPERDLLLATAAEMEKPFLPPVILRPMPWYHEMIRRIHVFYLPVTLAGLAASVAILAWPRLRDRRPLTVMAWLCLASSTVLFAQVLTLAMVTVTEGRYADALRTLAAFSLVCALAALVSLLVALIGLRRNPHPAPNVAG